MRPIKMVQR